MSLNSRIRNFSPKYAMRRLRYDWKHGGAVITKAIIAICVIVWIIEQIVYFTDSAAFQTMLYRFSFVPALASSRPWMYITSMFMHAPSWNFWHILCNMISVYYVGLTLERYLGHWQFLVLYLLCGIGGGSGDMVYTRIVNTEDAWVTPSLGASGAIFGLMGAMLVGFSHMHLDVRGLVGMIVINLALPLLVPNVAWQAHVGGLLTGAGSSLMVMGLPNQVHRVLNTLQRTIVAFVVTAVIVIGIAIACGHTSDVAAYLAPALRNIY